MIRSFYNSKTANILVLSSLLLAILLFVLWSVMRIQFTEQFYIIESKDEIVSKMNIILNLIETARARTRLTQELIVQDDFFVKDEISSKLDSLAARFAQKRQEFLSFQLSEFEQNVVYEQNIIINIILKKQREVVEMIMEETAESNLKAQQTLFSEVMPGQGQLVDLFMDLINYYEGKITKKTGEAKFHYETYNKVQIYLLFFIVTIGFFISLWVSKRIILVEQELHKDKTLIHSTLMSLADAVVITDTNGIIIDCNHVAETILRLPQEEIINKEFVNIAKITSKNKLIQFENDIKEIFKSNMDESIADDVELHFENSNDLIYLDLQLSPILDNDENRNKFGCIVTFRDISEKKILEKKIHHQANFDALTGLMNRYAFETKCNDLLENLLANNEHCLCILDLDRFKAINDNCGHKAGDTVLKEISSLIKSCLRNGDTFARIGGDEFTVIFENCPVKNAKQIMNTALSKISEYKFRYNNEKYSLGCSIGITNINNNNKVYKKVFNQADQACYQAKNNGRNQVVIYKPELIESGIELN
ncbi:MAG: diguanylate cyclase [Gammaproteobacteria bacterium]|nr:diguanylate cyclase [Gammaproteobacteria bacterium]